MSDPSCGLHVDRLLRRQQMRRAVEVRPEVHALLVDLSPRREAEHLIAAAVGEDRMRPADEAMQSAAAGDEVVSRPQIEVVGVAEDDRRAHVFEIARASSP